MTYMDPTVKQVSVELTARVYSRLSELAGVRGETVTDLLVTTAYRLSRLNVHSDEVAILWAQGFTDAQIAAELGWTNNRVAVRRRRFRLPANRVSRSRFRPVRRPGLVGREEGK